MAAASFWAASRVAVFVEVFHGDGSSELVELVHLFEELEDALRLGLVDARQGEADVDEHVLADLHLGHVLQADALADAAEIDLAHEHVVLAVGLDHFAGNAEAHEQAPSGCIEHDGRRDRQLAQAQAAVVGRHQAMAVDAKAVAAQPRG